MKKHLAPLVLLLLPLLAESALAGSFSIVGGANFVGLNQDGVSTKAAPVAGILLDGGIAPGVFDLELGALYSQFKYGSGDTNLGSTYTEPRIEIPLTLRLISLPIISFGAGGYYSHGIGQVSETDYLAGASVDSSHDFPDESDWGLNFDARATFQIAPTTALLADANYLYGLTDHSGYNYRGFQFLGGISFGY